MAIRLEHQPIGITGLAAYAAGSGRKKERDRKYATDLVLGQQARADKYNLLANQQQFIIGRDRERAGVDAAADVRRNAFRIGEINLADMKARERDEERAKTMTEMDTLDFDRSEFRDSRDYTRSVYAELDPVPTDLPPGAQRNALEKAYADVGAFTAKKFDVSEPDTWAGFNEAVNTYNALRSAVKTPSPAEGLNKGLSHYDPGTGSFGPKTDNSIPYLNGKPLDLPQPAEPVDTVPFRGQQVPVEMYQEHVKGISETQKQWDQGYSNAVTPAEKKEFEDRVGPRPESPPSVMDLRYPETTQPVTDLATEPPDMQEPVQENPVSPQQPQDAGNSISTGLKTGLGVLAPVFGGMYALGRRRAQQAASAQTQDTKPEDRMKKSVDTFIPRPTTQAEYEAVPPGEIYIGSDGKPRRKGTQ